jgi:hypothetical protein
MSARDEELFRDVMSCQLSEDRLKFTRTVKHREQYELRTSNKLDYFLDQGERAFIQGFLAALGDCGDWDDIIENGLN